MNSILLNIRNSKRVWVKEHLGGNVTAGTLKYKTSGNLHCKMFLLKKRKLYII